jgi:SAM-dependent methyltransferase
LAEYNEVYRRAGYYHIAFRRDVTREVDFLFDLYRIRTGRALTSMIDIACGPGYHARLFAARGVRAHGLDLRPEMIEFGRDHAEAEGVSVDWMASDMRSFRLREPVDLALTSYDSIDCLSSQDELVAHFRAVAQNLTPGGLYIFELTHPRDCSMWKYGDFLYAGEEAGVRVEIQFAVTPPKADPVSQILETEVEMRVTGNGVRETFHDRAFERFGTPQEYIALGKLSGALEVMAFYGDYRLDQPFDNSPQSRRWITVMGKAG